MILTAPLPAHVLTTIMEIFEGFNFAILEVLHLPLNEFALLYLFHFSEVLICDRNILSLPGLP